MITLGNKIILMINMNELSNESTEKKLAESAYQVEVGERNAIRNVLIQRTLRERCRQMVVEFAPECLRRASRHQH